MEYFNTLEKNDKIKLSLIHTLIGDNREQVITEWTSSPKIKFLIEATNTTILDFKNNYACNIFDFFYTYTLEHDDNITCPTAKLLLTRYKDIDDIIQLLTIACTELKNIMLKLIISADMDPQLKLEIFSIYSNLFDLNLTSIISEHSNYLQLLIKNNLKSLETLENNSVVSKTDVNGIITFASASYTKLTGYKSSELIGKSHNILRHPEVSSRIYEQMWKRLKKGKQWQGKLMNYTKYKELLIMYVKIIPIFDLDHNIVGYTAIRTNETDSIQARTDALTGIMNRLDFNKQLTTMTINTTPFSLVMIDIDFFKDVNDTYGHVVGDEVLKHFTKVISKTIRPTDIFARWGGEEFVLLLKDNDGGFDSHLEAVERIRNRVASTDFPTIGKKTASFGLVSYSDDYTRVLDFVDAADKCLYHAKNNGRNCIAYKLGINEKLRIFTSK